ncbi:MAG: type VI secretion system protein TssA [Cellvibrionaceae bacterium]|nr:type VI secretion system protein TssA [Cellvibrionaceae bacterium]
MTFPSTIDIAELLKPISDESPVGEDIREDRSPTSDYYFIKDARNNARAAERNAMFGNEEIDLVSPWRDVSKGAEKVLSKKGKDLEVACWYLEALVRTKGWAGLRDGIKLMCGLVDNYWDGIYPLPDEDGIETKVAPLTGLNGDGAEGSLIAPLRNTEVTQGDAIADYSIYEYQQARDCDRIADDKAKAERIGVLGYSFKEVQEAISTTDDQWCLNLVETLEETIEDYKTLVSTLREHCGGDAPPSTNISKILDEVLRTVRYIYQARLDALQTTAEAQELPQDQERTATSNGAATTAPAFVAGAINNREDALRALEQAALYFRRNEPHTPIAAGVERLVVWGRMTVSELMIELLPDDNSRNTYSALTGVKLDGTDSASYVPPPVIAARPSAAATTGNNDENPVSDNSFAGPSSNIDEGQW